MNTVTICAIFSAFVLFFAATTYAVPYPIFDKAELQEMIDLSLGERSVRLPGSLPSFKRSHKRTTIPEVVDFLRQAKIQTGETRKYGEVDIRKYWPHAWLEAQAPLTYSLKAYLPDSDGNYGMPVIHAIGEFNSTIECSTDVFCFFLNQRSQQFVMPNGTLTPVTYDASLFLFKEPGRMTGIDNALVGTGTFGDAQEPIFGYPVPNPGFDNILNPSAILTADTFSTRPSGMGGDAGVGANYYWTTTSASGTPTVTVNIQSMFHIIDPTTAGVVLLADQRTTGTIPIPV